MTLPTEFSFTEDALVYRAVRLWAFVELADRLCLDNIKIVGADPELLSVLKTWGRETGRQITAADSGKNSVTLLPSLMLLPRSSHILIQFLAALSRITLEFARYGLKFRSTNHGIAPKNYELTVVDYFDNFQVSETRDSRYQSNYWGPLPETLAHKGTQIHWVHIDYRSAAVPSVSVARHLIDDLNKNAVNQRHSLLQDQMSPSDLIRVLQQYFAIATLGLKARLVNSSWRNTQSGLDMWPLVKRPWRRAFYGAEAARNATWLILSESLLGGKTKPGTCFYLMENQAWELAFVNRWQANQSGSIAGVPHSTVRIWDLRYAVGKADKHASGPEGPPRPDQVLVNGPAALEVLVQNGFSQLQLKPVEALRYLISADLPMRELRRNSNKLNPLNLLALGEFDPGLAVTQIEMLNKLIEARPDFALVTYRPHPSLNMTLESLDRRIQLSTSPRIETDLDNSDLVFCSNVSSASIDATLRGVPIITFRDGSVLDGQIAGVPGSVSITNTMGLIEAADQFLASELHSVGQQSNIFYLDSECPRWERVLFTL